MASQVYAALTMAGGAGWLKLKAPSLKGLHSSARFERPQHHQCWMLQFETEIVWSKSTSFEEKVGMFWDFLGVLCDILRESTSIR